jgi:hypothetical protein
MTFGLTRYFGYRFTIGFMIARELTQIEVFSLQSVCKDTGGDLLAGSIGIFLSVKF